MLVKTLRHELQETIEQGEAALIKAMETAESENRELTAEEQAEADRWLEKAREIEAKIRQAEGHAAKAAALKAVGRDLAVRGLKPEQNGDGDHDPRGDGRRIVASIGQQFVESAAHDFIRAGHARGAHWQTPTVELVEPRAVLQTDGAGGPLLVPEYRPGIQTLPFPQLVLADLFAPGTTESNQVVYMRETTFTNAAAPVAEGAVKPESALAFEQVNEPVRKIAHWLPVSDEMLEDVPQIRSFIDARLLLGLSLTEEEQLLNGSGVAPALLGLRQRTGLAAPVAAGAAPDWLADAIFRQIMAITVNSLSRVDSIVINPLDWGDIMLAKNAQGVYYAGGPFQAQVQPALWGYRAVPTPAMPQGTALVGAFSTQAQIFRRGGIGLDASNSHADYFIRNITAIRAEKRLALAVYRPGAFGEVTTTPPI